ncbi:uncharacterized protein DUF4260 [Pseudacidovorax intermedius]|jgi:Domain of unknown function (DUF4260)|uniref:Uncharacterized protein DUF4260 n=1 Tax=Pseudacidovorax intermedius TaxID=433924 RepID=A0A370FSN3_9BURK|nr:MULTISPECIES: DUF4260 domain-containing protein [Pseudacidovorax]RDI29369.1 uncharacterized protein DUF4260 [Pseudacidovorax intermedius]
MAEALLGRQADWAAAEVGHGPASGEHPGPDPRAEARAMGEAESMAGRRNPSHRAVPTVDAGAVQGGVRLLLRAEGAALLVFAVLAYTQLAPGQWGRFAALLLLPDLAMLGYLAGPAIGARAYNAAHSVVGPVLLAAAGFALPTQAAMLWPLAAIWLAHVGLDRLLGYGLKYGRGFGHTHLGRLGPRDPW